MKKKEKEKTKTKTETEKMAVKDKDSGRAAAPFRKGAESLCGAGVPDMQRGDVVDHVEERLVRALVLDRFVPHPALQQCTGPPRCKTLRWLWNMEIQGKAWVQDEWRRGEGAKGRSLSPRQPW